MNGVLLVEDDTSLSEPLARALRREGYHVQIAADGIAALVRSKQDKPDLVVLDLGLPHLDGLQVCEQMRRNGLSAPVLILSGRSAETDAVVCLDAGADDYITKPFRLAELLARIRVLLRRRIEPAQVDDPPIVVDAEARRVFCNGLEVSLTTKELDLLRVLSREEGCTLTREALMREVWGFWVRGRDKTLDMHVSLLRHKLGDDASHPQHIITVRGIGFRFQNAPEATRS
jgi:DNA-binding response OmpR family regulator